MRLKKRIILQTLTASLVFTLLVSVSFFYAVMAIRNEVLSNSGELGDKAALISSYALEDQVIEKTARVAADLALLLNEKLIKIENYTRTTADIAGTIYSSMETWRPVPLPYVRPGELSPKEPYLHIAPGVNYSQIRREAELAANTNVMLRQVTEIDRGIVTSSIGGESGFAIAMDAAPWPAVDFDPRDYPWYQKAKETEDIYWSDVYLDPRGKGPVIACAVPFFDSSGGKHEFKGIARSTMLLDDLSTIIDSTKVGRSGYIFLVNRAGRQLFSSSIADVPSGESWEPEGENFLKSRDPRIRSLGMSMTLGASGMTRLEMEGVPAYLAYAPIPALKWSLGVVVPEQEIAASALFIEEQIQGLTGEAKTVLNQYILYLAGVMGIMMIIMLCIIALFSIRFSTTVTSPILTLNERVREISGGNLDREVQIKTGDEIEQLASSFNAMTIRLRKHIEWISRDSAERERIATELDVATRIQTSMLPAAFPPFPGRKNEFDLFAQMIPAKEVGGDFYDFFFIDESHFAVIIADVSGKGVPAALFMAVTKTLIKNNLQSGEHPELSMKNVNRRLCNNNTANMFVTMWLGVLEIASGRLRYVNAGHNPPLLRRAGESFSFLVSPPDLVLAGMDDTVYHCRETMLEDGDTLFLYTDGITEAAAPDGGFYGKEKMRSFLDTYGDSSPWKLLTLLRADLEEFSGRAEQHDDITMLAIRMNREKAPGPAVRYSVIITADIGKLEELFSFINNALEKAACPEKTLKQIELAAEEIFVNIAQHAYQDGIPADREVTIDCEITETEKKTVAAFSFADRGMPFNPLENPEPDTKAPLEKREIGGLGLLLVKRTMDSVKYSRDGEMNRLVITKSWQTGGAGRAAAKEGE